MQKFSTPEYEAIFLNYDFPINGPVLYAVYTRKKKTSTWKYTHRKAHHHIFNIAAAVGSAYVIFQCMLLETGTCYYAPCVANKYL